MIDSDAIERLRQRGLNARVAPLRGTAEDHDATIEVLGWDEAVLAMAAGIEVGAYMFQRFICEGCRAIQTIPKPDHVYMIGRCEECAHLTDLRVTGFGVLGIAAVEGATPDEVTRFEQVIGTASKEIAATPNSYVLRAQGIEPDRKVHRAPCRNCGQPFHPGQPCKIEFRAGRRRMR